MTETDRTEGSVMDGSVRLLKNRNRMV